MTHPPQLPPERVMMRLEHLMSEITTHPFDHDTATAERPAATVSPLRRDTGRRRLALAAGVAASVLVGSAAAGVALAGSDTLGSPAFAVTAVGSDVRIDIVDAALEAQQMTDQLKAEGLDVTVQTTAVSEQLVGTWISVGSDGTTSDATYAAVSDQAIGYTDAIVVPGDVSGLVLTVGVEATPGQDIAVVGQRNGFAPGAPLACSAARGATVAAATKILTAEGYTVTTVEYGSLAPTPAADSDVVTSVFYTDEAPEALMLVTTPDVSEAKAQAQLALGFSPAHTAGTDCR